MINRDIPRTWRATPTRASRASRVFLVHVRHPSIADLYHFAEQRFCRASLKEGFVRLSIAVCILFVAFTSTKVGGWSDSADLGAADRKRSLCASRVLL